MDTSWASLWALKKFLTLINQNYLEEQLTNFSKKISRGCFYVKIMIMIMPLKVVSRFSRMLALKIGYMP